MSQRALADELGLQEQTVQQLERGKRQIKAPELGRIARTFDFTTAELIDGLGFAGEPISVTGGGKAGTKGRGNRG